jgi:hypothetical protein
MRKIEIRYLINIIKMTSFPEYFQDSFYSHMFLSQITETFYELHPPNQQDWYFKIIKVSETKWHVKGHKEQDFVPEDYDEMFELQDGKWKII